MAFVFKNPNSKNWIAGFRDEQGKRKNRSTGLKGTERNKRKAERIADEFEAVANRQKGALQVKETLAQLLKDTGLGSGEELPSCSVREYAAKFIEIKSTDVGASSISSYRKSFENLCDWLKERADAPMDAISVNELKLFRKHIIESFAARTATRKIKAVKALFSEAHADGYILANPASRLKVAVGKDDEEQMSKRPFTLEEIKLLKDNATDEWRSMIYFGLYTGQRLGDLATLRWTNLNLEQKEFNIFTNKTGRKVTIPFSETLLEHILTLDAPDDPLAFVHPSLGKQYDDAGSSAISNQFTDLLAECGLREPVSHKSKGIGREGKRASSGLGFHCLRVTAVTLLHEAGIPQATVQEWVGHNSPEVHRLYIKLGKQAGEKASNALPKI